MNSEVKTTSGFYPNTDVNVWLRSCEKEVLEPLEGTITGNIPLWLEGSLLRNGPGSLKVGNEHFDHLFDSSALLHRFGIKDGKVTYQCRFLQSEVYKRNKAANRIVLNEFGTKAVPDPCRSIFQRVATAFFPNIDDVSDNSMISIYPFADEIFAFGEVPFIHKINAKNLETKELLDVRKYVSIVHHTSHPHVMKDGTVYNLAMTVSSTGPQFAIVKFPNSENKSEKMFQQSSIIASVPARWPLHPSYMHTFGITENYFIIVEQSMSISLGSLIMSKLRNNPIVGCFRWYEDEKTQINLLSRKTGQLVFKFYAKGFFYFHIINQFETDDYVVLDICTYRDPGMLNSMYIKAMKEMQENPNYAEILRSTPLRFVLPLSPDKAKENLIKLQNTKATASYLPNWDILVEPERLSNFGCELPRINYDFYLGKEYRYFYAISADVDAPTLGAIIKVDTRDKTSKVWFEENCYASEPIFVASPESKFEDDGIILSALVWSDNANKVGLLVLDARSWKEIGRATFKTEGPVPKCLHGWFLSEM